MPKYKNIFIDIDDTLWDFTSNSKLALQIVYQQFGIDQYYPDFEVFYAIYSQKNIELWNLYHHGRIDKQTLMKERFNHLFYRLGMDKPVLSEQLDEAYLSHLAEQKILVPYTMDLLHHLHGRYKIFTISNGFKEVQYKKMAAGGIDSFFDRVVLSDEIGVTKPSPEIFEYALRVTNSHPENSLMIGDNYDADIVGAANFGMDQIYYNPLNNSFNGIEPTYTVSSLHEIIIIL